MRMLTRPKKLDLGPVKAAKIGNRHKGLVVEWFQTQGFIGELLPKFTKEQIAAIQKHTPCFVPLKKDEIAIYNGDIFGKKNGGIVMFGSLAAARAVKKACKGKVEMVTCGPDSWALYYDVFAPKRES